MPTETLNSSPTSIATSGYAVFPNGTFAHESRKLTAHLEAQLFSSVLNDKASTVVKDSVTVSYSKDGGATWTVWYYSKTPGGVQLISGNLPEIGIEAAVPASSVQVKMLVTQYTEEDQNGGLVSNGTLSLIQMACDSSPVPSVAHAQIIGL